MKVPNGQQGTHRIKERDGKLITNMIDGIEKFFSEVCESKMPNPRENYNTKYQVRGNT